MKEVIAVGLISRRRQKDPGWFMMVLIVIALGLFWLYEGCALMTRWFNRRIT